MLATVAGVGAAVGAVTMVYCETTISVLLTRTAYCL